MRIAARIGLLGAVVPLLLLGCSGGDPGTAPRTAPSPTIETLRADGDGRLAAHDWAGALEAYELALRLHPDDVRLRYLAGVALSHLDRGEDAAAAFLWVVEHAPTGTEEARMADDWLRASTARDTTAGQEGRREAPIEGGGGVEGRTEWASLPPDTAPPRLQILLSSDGPGPARRFGTSVRLGERYRIVGVPSGSYRLAAQVGMTRLWQTTVSVEEGRATTVDLLPATSLAAPDALARTPAS